MKTRCALWLRGGLDVARVNFSHGTHETQAQSIELLRQLAASEGANLPIIADLQGPKVRVGTIADAPLRLPPGGQLILTVDGDDADAAARQRLQDYANSVDPEAPQQRSGAGAFRRACCGNAAGRHHSARRRTDRGGGGSDTR